MIQRHLEPLIRESLQDFPVVLMTGARQVGKSTLAQALCRRKWRATYLTLDDRNLLDAALTDPDGLIAANPGPVVIDEVQRAPDLLRAVKLEVDRRRMPGRFLLTGSANVLTLKRVSETLAGRIALHQLLPFSYAELRRRATPPMIVPQLFQAAEPRTVIKAIPKSTITSQQLLTHILHGGYPPAALSGKPSLRTKWFEAYRTAYIERDILELQTVERLPEFSRLMVLVAARTGQVLNFADLGRDAGLPYVTLRRYMQLLEQTYQVILVPPFFSNASKRLPKAPKLYWSDTGMASHLLGLHEVTALQRHPTLGALVETWVAQELLKLLSVSPTPMRLYGWRLQSGPEVDFLIEQGNRFLAIEAKWGRRLDPSALHGIRLLQEQLGSRLIMSIILYGGEEVLAVGPRLMAVPHDLFFGGP